MMNDKVSASGVVRSREDGVLRLTLSRPERLNALNYAAIDAIKAGYAEAARDPGIRCVLLLGEGRAFCAGDDLTGMGESPADMDPVDRAQTLGYVTALRAARELGKPVVVGVQGYCLGAGFELALSADVRIVARDARLGTRFIRLGLSSGAYLLPRAVGITRALDVLFTGRELSGDEADRWGLVTELVETGEDVRAAAEAWAARLSQMPTRALGYIKRVAYGASEMSMEQGFRELAFTSAIAHTSEDYLEAKRAWRAGEKPTFHRA
jgi:2-(1,2-epoxy-1,2-dihydrophenyl)acetyl-CoA isomerase